MTGLTARLDLSRSTRRWSVADLAISFALGSAAVIVAFVATERLSGRSPLIALSLGLLVVLPAWLVFSANYKVTLAVVMLYLGLLDGVIKLKLDNPVATLGRDVLLYSIVFGAVARMALSKRSVKLPPLSGFVLAFVVIVLVQIFNPGTDGILRGLAAARPHLEFVPLFFFGYILMREPRLLRMFLLLLCVIAAANGIVSLIQFNLTPDQLSSWGPGYDKLINGAGDLSGRTFFDATTGTKFLRPFGLGPDTGFGGYVGVLAVPAMLALFATADRRWAGRLGAPLSVGILLAIATSQTRSAVIASIVALVAFCALALASRRSVLALLGVVALVSLMVSVAGSLAGTGNGAALGRYDSISPGNVLGSTISSRGGSLGLLPKYVERYPLGAGLGHVGPGASLATTTTARTDPLNGETEFNFLVIEVGVAGLLVFLVLQLRLLALSTRLRRVADPETRLLLAGCAASLFGIAASWITGPVSAGTPTSPFLWFTAGILAYWLLGPGAAPERAGARTAATR
jgi:hypothetical protein